MSRRLVILDRDGVINRDSDDFIKSPDEWVPIPGSLEAIGRLSRAGFDVAVASNQSGIGRKLLDEPALELIHQKMRAAAREFGGDIGKIAYCPHHPDAGCDCRKPKPGMLLMLSRKYGVPLTNVPFVGDSVRDVEAAIAVGARAILVQTGSGLESEPVIAERGLDAEVFADLAAAVDELVEEARGG
ncbi:MAG: D-glycero-beta-D-manno-heptose 1,7-bisphosphate 7-phosphatase [Planctomycetota bacterium]|nr:D-glycero-beta-D-manno-heptose 1,7-bisphosphate 7-phosphatase [Planctomycetota bacterium]